MNKHLRAYAEAWIKDALDKCTEAQRNLFIRMNSDPLKGKQSVEDVLKRMGPAKLNDHMDLLESFVERNKKEATEGKTEPQVTHSEPVPKEEPANAENPQL